MILSPSSTALDARVVNLYTLTFTTKCRGETKDAQLFVQVIETKKLVCNEGYTDIGKNAAASLIKLVLAHSTKDKSALMKKFFNIRL